MPLLGRALIAVVNYVAETIQPALLFGSVAVIVAIVAARSGLSFSDLLELWRSVQHSP